MGVPNKITPHRTASTAIGIMEICRAGMRVDVLLGPNATGDMQLLEAFNEATGNRAHLDTAPD